jgi:hypothetical protein
MGVQKKTRKFAEVRINTDELRKSRKSSKC